MFKKSLRMKQIDAMPMTPDATLESARMLMKRLESDAYFYEGRNTKAFMASAEKYGLPKNFFWNLRYRPPKNIAVHVYNRLLAASLGFLEALNNGARSDILTLRHIHGSDEPELARLHEQAESLHAEIKAAQKRYQAAGRRQA